MARGRRCRSRSGAMGGSLAVLRGPVAPHRRGLRVVEAVEVERDLAIFIAPRHPREVLIKDRVLRAEVRCLQHVLVDRVSPQHRDAQGVRLVAEGLFVECVVLT